MPSSAVQQLSSVAYTLMRVLTGLMFSFHGMQKVLGIMAKSQPAIGSQVWIGGMIELICGLGIALGLFTRWNALLSSGTMLVAYAQFHWKFSFDERFIPTINRGELALVYCLLFLYVALTGPGMWSLDRKWRGAKS